MFNYSAQKISSKDTCLNQVPALFHSKHFEFHDNTVNLDIGGGKYNIAIEFLKSKNITNIIYDPFNRSEDFNVKSEKIAKDLVDSVTITNVLNVIQEEEVRLNLLECAYQCLKNNKKIYIQIYEGNKTGIGKITKRGFQANLRTQSYIPEIEKVFGKVTRKGFYIIGQKNVL